MKTHHRRRHTSRERSTPNFVRIADLFVDQFLQYTQYILENREFHSVIDTKNLLTKRSSQNKESDWRGLVGEYILRALVERTVSIHGIPLEVLRGTKSTQIALGSGYRLESSSSHNFVLKRGNAIQTEFDVVLQSHCEKNTYYVLDATVNRTKSTSGYSRQDQMFLAARRALRKKGITLHKMHVKLTDGEMSGCKSRPGIMAIKLGLQKELKPLFAAFSECEYLQSGDQNWGLCALSLGNLSPA